MRLAGVYVMTNEPGGNDILVFGRGPDGALSQIQTVSTQGKGSYVGTAGFSMYRLQRRITNWF